MRTFIAGATGVIGIRLVPLMVSAGHTVAGMTRTPEGARRLEALGAAAVICDVYDHVRLVQEVTAFAPELVVHELTDLPDSLSSLSKSSTANSRMRREGTDNLLAAATTAGATKLLAQSIAWEPAAGEAADAKQHLENEVLKFGGVVIRYGQLYGPGTFYEDEIPDHPRIHVDEAARQTLDLVNHTSGVVDITDERDPDMSDPAPRQARPNS